MSARDPLARMAPAASAAQRRAHARARRSDAARLLPVAGLALFLSPDLLIGDGAGATARWGVALFAGWAALILAAALLSRRLARDAAPDAAPDPGAATADPPG